MANLNLGRVKGDRGKDAYAEWLDLGNSGTTEDFLNYLKGEKGDKGDKGEKGDTGERGEKGEKGNDGQNGITETELNAIIAATAFSGSYNDLSNIPLFFNPPNASAEIAGGIKIFYNETDSALYITNDGSDPRGE